MTIPGPTFCQGVGTQSQGVEHRGNVYNLQFLSLIVHIMCYPPHTTHALQPADKSFFKYDKG